MFNFGLPELIIVLAILALAYAGTKLFRKVSGYKIFSRLIGGARNVRADNKKSGDFQANDN